MYMRVLMYTIILTLITKTMHKCLGKLMYMRVLMYENIFQLMMKLVFATLTMII